MRYTLCLEAFSVWLFALVLRRFLPLRLAAVILLVVWGFALYKPFPRWHRHPFISKTMVVPAVASVPDGAFVLIAGHLSFLVPFLNPRARYAGGVWFNPDKFPPEARKEVSLFNWLQPGDYQHRFAPRIKQEIAHHAGPVYVLAPVSPWVWEDALWADYGLKVRPSAKDCRFFAVSPDVLYDGFVLCQAYKAD